MSLGSSMPAASTFPSIQLLGLEMLLHYLVGPEVVACAAKNKLVLSLGGSHSAGHHLTFNVVLTRTENAT